MPHGHCYLWQPGILWTNVISDLVIASAYFSIPFVLLFIVIRRNDQKFKGIFVLFALFIFSCGLTHLFAIYTIWHGNYGLHGILKAITALVSAITAFVLYYNLDKLIAIPTPTELKVAQENAAEERVKRLRLEIESRTNSIFQFSIELFPSGVLVVNPDQKIHITNKILEETFGYEKGELVNQNIDILIAPEQIPNHHVLVSEYIKNPGDQRQMAAGRVVWGITKSGQSIPVEISLTVHEIENEKYTFASVVSVNEVGNQKKQFLESSRRLQRAVDATDVGIWEWNILSDRVWFSPKFITLLNTKNHGEQMQLDEWQSHIHPNDRAEVQSTLKKHLAGDGPFDVVYRGENVHNEYKWLRMIGNTVFDSAGKPLLMSGTLTSVNQLKTLQLELEKKNQFLDAVLAQSNSAIFIVDIKTKQLKFANKQVTTLWGYLNEDFDELLQDDAMEDICHPEDLEALKQYFANIKNAGIDDKQTIELRIKHKHGFWVWSLVKTSIYTDDPQAHKLEVMGTAIDLSEIKQREESNNQLAKEFLDTFEQAAVGIAHVGLDGKWLKANQRLCEILGYSNEELLQKTFQELTYPDDLKSDETLVQKVIDRHINNYTLEKRYLQKSGTIIWARLTVSLVAHDDDRSDYFVSVVEDISQQKQLEYNLLKSNEELEQFAYVASHDLKEPLRTMQTYTSYLIKDLEANNTERVQQDKEFIDHASKRMTALIDDLLQFSRVGSTEDNLTQVSVYDLVEGVVKDLQTKIEETQATINISPSLPDLVSDASKLRLALQNIIQNALKFCQSDCAPIVSISAEQTGNNLWLIHIQDNGIGIDEAYQTQIFGLFKKLHSNTEYQGTGLGLAIVKKIMQSLDGDITLHSSLGKGSTFTLHIQSTT